VPPPNGHIPLETPTIDEKTWRNNFYAAMTVDEIAPKSPQKAFVRAFQKLLDLNLIGKWADHVWLA
jgi:hypothetical protein